MDALKQAQADELIEKLANLFAEAENTDGSWKTFDQMELAANEAGDRVSERLAQSLNRFAYGSVRGAASDGRPYRDPHAKRSLC